MTLCPVGQSLYADLTRASVQIVKLGTPTGLSDVQRDLIKANRQSPAYKEALAAYVSHLGNCEACKDGWEK